MASNDTQDQESATDRKARRAAEEAFRKTFEPHGYGFQYAVQEHITQGMADAWFVEDSETPVQCKGKTIHVDLILRHAKKPEPRPVRIVGECKRTDPKENWYFVRTPLPRNVRTPLPKNEVFFERVVVRNKPENTWVRTVLETDPTLWPEGEIYGLGFPKGSRGQQTALDEAIAQVFRAASGLINRFGETDYLSQGLPLEARAGVIVPAIFTTATLWGSEIDLRHSSLRAGQTTRAPLRRHNWLWLRQNISPDLKHSLGPTNPAPSLSLADWTLNDYSRCVAVVSCKPGSSSGPGIDEFLLHWRWG